VGTTVLPPAAEPAAVPPPVSAAPSDSSQQPEAADHSVVLWDEVTTPEPAEQKPLSKDLPDDPAAH